MTNFTFNTTKKIICELGGIKSIAEECRKLGINKILVVTDVGIINAGIFEQLESVLNSENIKYCVFDAVQADPSEEQVLDACEFALAHQIDGLIGFGGGSPMDVAKLVSMLCANESTQGNQRKTLTTKLKSSYGVEQVTAGRLPLVLVPTTAGTGSEVTPISIVTTGETTKSGVVSSILLPDLAILDACLTVKLPAMVTAATGVDAMVHAIEAYTSLIKKNPMSDVLAQQALRLLSANIKTATFQGQDLEARQAMLLGACLAGQAFANAPVAAVHALAYPLGGQFHLPHGLSNALVLVPVMRFNLSHCDVLYSELSGCMHGLTRTNEHSWAEDLVNYLSELIQELALPTCLRDVGIKQDDIQSLAEDAMKQTRLLVNNPKTLTLEDVKRIYQEAL
jgi:alcohol dehydrogenase